MNASFFSKKEPSLRPMKRSDLPKVIAIINDHDEDDAEEAQQSLMNSIEGMFVLEEGGGFSLEESGGLFGVTGARPDPDVEDVAWLSWTYVAEDRQGEGWGKMMMEQIIEMLRQEGVRKLFIATSDYMEDGEDIYADAKALYEAAGAELELTVPEFHDEEESQLIYGLSLMEVETETSDDIEKLEGIVEFYDVNPLPECEDGYALNWRMAESEEQVPSSLEQLRKYVSEGQQHEARFLLSTIPTDLSHFAEPAFENVGFKHIGNLKDYHAPGLHQEYWMKKF